MIPAPSPAWTPVRRVWRPLFERCKGSKFKIAGTFAAKAHGLTTRNAILDRVADSAGLPGAGCGGCACAPRASDAGADVFCCRQEA
jgi:cytoplasmic iron level regulating protein YaaA (DUF328/UPF0246 family)